MPTHLELSATTLAACRSYAEAACRRVGIRDVNTIKDVEQYAVLAALIGTKTYDRLRDRNGTGVALRARYLASRAARLSARRARELMRTQVTNREDVS